MSADNRLVYPDAFENVAADLVYECRRNGLAQEAVLRGRLPDPAETGLNPETTYVEVVTEFLEAPVPVRRSRVLRSPATASARSAMADPDWVDETLEFGTCSSAST